MSTILLTVHDLRVLLAAGDEEHIACMDMNRLGQSEVDSSVDEHLREQHTSDDKVIPHADFHLQNEPLRPNSATAT